MTAWDRNRLKNVVLASGLGLACSLTGATYAQTAPGTTPGTTPPGSALENASEAPAPGMPGSAPEDAPAGLFDEGAADMEGQDVAVDSLGQIDITVKDLEIAKVLQLLSIQSQRNIIASRNVSGKVSADLYGVSFHEALEAILTPNGYGYEEKGNFIYVYTAQELKERRDAMRKTSTKIIRLNYISAADAAQFLAPLLSDKGTITATAEADAGFLPSQSDGGENTFAHPDTILVRDYEENVAEIQSVLVDLDVRPQQVLVEATILQAQLTESNAFGVDFAVFANFDGLDFANPLNAVDELITGGGAGTTAGGGTAIGTTVGGTQSGAAGVKLGIVGSEGAVFLRALDQVTDTTVLAKPNILVLNRQKADLLVGQRLGYLSTTVTDTSETQTIEFLDVGTQLTVRPFITDQGTIRMELRPSVSDGTTRLEGNFIIPDETTQELVTNVIVESGQTVVLGGLFIEDTTVNRNQVPVLGDIPIIGAAFKGQDDNMTRNEVIFMVKTTIMENTDMAMLGRKAQERIHDNRIAIRKGLLPFSTDKLVSAHLLNARRHMDEGDADKAMWDVNLALHLSPTSEDAIALKEEIKGRPIGYHDRTFWGDVSDDMADAELGVSSQPMPAEDEAAMLQDSLGLTQDDPASPPAAADQPIVFDESLKQAVREMVARIEHPMAAGEAPAADVHQPVAEAAAEDAAASNEQAARLQALKATFAGSVAASEPTDNAAAMENQGADAIAVDRWEADLAATGMRAAEAADAEPIFDEEAVVEVQIDYDTNP